MLRYRTIKKQSHASKFPQSFPAESYSYQEVTLAGLLEKLENDYRIYKKINNVKYPRCLIKSLRQLSEIYGVDSIKNSIASQTWYIINHDNKLGLPMLNSCIYGSPGTGKTTIAAILAKIWASIGILDHNISYMEKVIIRKGLKTAADRITYIIVSIFAIIVSLFSYGKVFLDLLNGLNKLYGISLKYVLILLAAIVMAISYYVISYSEQSYMQRWETGKIADIDNSNVIITLGREDLVASYLGQTAEKTYKALANNIGKVIFIDEVYSLYQGPSDSYGAEALNVITQFTTEHKGKFLLIFAGYEDKIRKQLFKIQPGLPRRFTWHFRMDKYTPRQLYQIFNKQLAQKALEIPKYHSRKCLQMLADNFDSFVNFGGDTEKLVTHIQFITTSYLLSYPDHDIKQVTPEILSHAIKRFKDHNVDETQEN